MIGSMSRMTSPSIVQSRRSTPCVAGWCGPRLTVKSSSLRSRGASVPMIGAVFSLIPTRHLVLVEGEQDRLAAHREVAPLRVARIVLGHQDPAQVRVTLEDHAEHVVGLALLEVGAREQVDD